MAGSKTDKLHRLTSSVLEWCRLRMAFCAHCRLERVTNAHPTQLHYRFYNSTI